MNRNNPIDSAFDTNILNQENHAAAVDKVAQALTRIFRNDVFNTIERIRDSESLNNKEKREALVSICRISFTETSRLIEYLNNLDDKLREEALQKVEQEVGIPNMSMWLPRLERGMAYFEQVGSRAMQNDFSVVPLPPLKNPGEQPQPLQKEESVFQKKIRRDIANEIKKKRNLGDIGELSQALAMKALNNNFSPAQTEEVIRSTLDALIREIDVKRELEDKTEFYIYSEALKLYTIQLRSDVDPSVVEAALANVQPSPLFEDIPPPPEVQPPETFPNKLWKDLSIELNKERTVHDIGELSQTLAMKALDSDLNPKQTEDVIKTTLAVLIVATQKAREAGNDTQAYILSEAFKLYRTQIKSDIAPEIVKNAYEKLKHDVAQLRTEANESDLSIIQNIAQNDSVEIKQREVRRANPSGLFSRPNAQPEKNQVDVEQTIKPKGIKGS